MSLADSAIASKCLWSHFLMYFYFTRGTLLLSGKDDSPGPKCSVKVTLAKDGKYKFVIKNVRGDNT